VDGLEREAGRLRDRAVANPAPPYPSFVILAEAGIHLLISRKRNYLEMDSRVRGNDEGLGTKVWE